MRSARRRTWLADSSPLTTSAAPCPAAAHCWATSSSSVDLPTPGSPASRTTPPGTSPPPSTRSSSATPVARARAGAALTSAMGRAGSSGVRGATVRPAWVRTAAGVVSRTEPHSPHSGQRPTHLAGWCPHTSHSKTGRGLFAAPRPAEREVTAAGYRPGPTESPDTTDRRGTTGPLDGRSVPDAARRAALGAVLYRQRAARHRGHRSVHRQPYVGDRRAVAELQGQRDGVAGQQRLGQVGDLQVLAVVGGEHDETPCRDLDVDRALRLRRCGGRRRGAPVARQHDAPGGAGRADEPDRLLRIV